MASSQNVELEAAKFLHKLIQDSTDEPAKLATKLYVILQHMKSSGKEHSMPYQVISRAMETVINQHSLDIEALKSSRLPLSGGAQIGSSSQVVGIAKDSRLGLAENEMPKLDSLASGRPPVAPSGGTTDYYQGFVAQRSSQSFDQGSPTSLDSRSANSQSQDRRDTANCNKHVNQMDGKKAATKRKRGDTSSPMELHVDSPRVDPCSTVVNARKGELTKAEPSDDRPVKSGDLTNFNMVPSSRQMENFPTLSGSGSEMTMLRQAVPSRDTGKSTVPAAPSSSAMPFMEQQLKQLRAQCLVFLAFRNGLPPKKLHLEIALGTTFFREGNSIGVMTQFGGLSNARQTDNAPSGSHSVGKVMESDSLLKASESPRMKEDKGNPHFDTHILPEERKHLAIKRGEFERQIQERVAAQASSAQQQDFSSTRGVGIVKNHLDDVDSGNLQVGRSSQPHVIGPNSWTGFAGHNEASQGTPQISTIQHGLPIERRDNIPHQFQNVNISMMKDGNVITKHISIDGFKTVPVDDASKLGLCSATEHEGNERLASADLPCSPKYTMSERWVMDQQKKRFLVEQNWVQKQQKTKQRMATSFLKLKENVNASEDISAKTKTVIELKKLQLLDIQRRLRSDLLNDFFKPITTEMDHMKSLKKHRHGRRVKQLEKFEQKMREERQKRTRERQKEFFGEIEVHKEKLDDVFKIKRERWKVFNRFAKEFHKRKERSHREKIDRIQREKINLLKINDVEGYLRMVQDAKSDRVKQLLKETEKYLQKLGSKLQEAKAAAGRLGQDVDESESCSFLENSEITLENDDENDQAKHYMESNEKYYMMAHSIKESIAEQPSWLQGGKLREYQMNGLRWLVSLYNNHLNGILADEMGLGKTVQVISLICYLMEAKNDRGPFLVVVPSSVLPGWESEINFWAPGIHRIVYAGPPEERRRLFKERIVHQKFNVLLTTYEYLMNKHDRPKLSKIHWHYIIIDEGHRIKNASCKLNTDLKQYKSSHRLLLTGTPLQNNLEELWALLNFLLPDIFNSSEDFSQWFNKPFESNGDNSPDEALLSEEENLLIINRLHQVLRPFVLRRLKHKVENELPEKIERLIRCEASAYQKLLMKRVEENLGAMGTSKARSVHNSVMELRNICNHPYLSQLHVAEVDSLIPKHYLPLIIRLCGKLEMLDRLLPKLKATDHRVLFFSTMTRLLDVMEEYLTLKQYRYLRLDGQTAGSDRGALIDLFNQPDSPYFIFLLSIRAGGVGVNLQAADTVILFDTDWNPQVDLQAQARAHRLGQKRDVLVLRFETVQTVEEQVRASAEHKLGVANQSITAGFFDNNTSAEDRREYLESLLRENKKEEAAPVLDDDALNHVLARSETELDVFEAVDTKRKENELAAWKKMVVGGATDGSDLTPPLPSRLVTDEDLKQFYEAMKLFDVPKGEVESSGLKRKSGNIGGLDTKHYGRGKRAREVRSYEEQFTEEEFEKMCQVESPNSSKIKEMAEMSNPTNASKPVVSTSNTEPTAVPPMAPKLPSVESLPVPQVKEIIPPAKRGRGRPKRITSDKLPPAVVPLLTSASVEVDNQLQKAVEPGHLTSSNPVSVVHSAEVIGISGPTQQSDTVVASSMPTIPPTSQSVAVSVSVPLQARGQGPKNPSGEGTRRRGKRQAVISAPNSGGSVGPDLKVGEQVHSHQVSPSSGQASSQGESTGRVAAVQQPTIISGSAGKDHLGAEIALNTQLSPHPPSVTPLVETDPTHPSVQNEQTKGQNRKSQTGAGAPRRRGRKQAAITPPVSNVPGHQDLHQTSSLQISSSCISGGKTIEPKSLQENNVQASKCIFQDQSSQSLGDQDLKPTKISDNLAKQTVIMSSSQHNSMKSTGLDLENVNNPDVQDSSVEKVKSSEITSSKIEGCKNSGNANLLVTTLPVTKETEHQLSGGTTLQATETSKSVASIVGTPTNSFAANASTEKDCKSDLETAKVVSTAPSSTAYPSAPGLESTQSSSLESVPVPAKRQGRKTQNRVEAPKRRGRRSASALPVVPEGFTGEKLIHHAQNSSGDSLVGKTTTNVTQAQASEILLPSGVSGHDSKRKERAISSTPSKQQKVASTRIDSAPASSDKIAAFGQVQNVNDVARVMKEVFSGTCLPRLKAQDSVGSEDRDTASVNVTTKAAVNVSDDKSSEDKPCSQIPTTIAACPASDVAADGHEKQSEEVSNVKNLEFKTASLDMPCTEVMSQTQGIPMNGDEQQSGSISDEKITPLNETLPNVSEPETSGCGDIKEKEEGVQQCVENLSNQSEMEVLGATPLNAAQKTDVSSETLPIGHGFSNFKRETSDHQIGSSEVSSGAEPHVVDQIEYSLEKSTPLDIGGAGCPATPLKPEQFSNTPESSRANEFGKCDSSTKRPPGFTECTSNEKLDPSESSPNSSSLSCGDGSESLVQAEHLGDKPQVAPSCPASTPHSRTMAVSSISDHAITCRNETESSFPASVEQSCDEGIGWYEVSASADHDRKNIADPLNFGLDPTSASVSEMESSRSCEPVQAQKNPDALESADLLEAPLIESSLELQCEERRGEGNSTCDQPVNIDPVPQESTVVPTPVGSSKDDFSQVHQMGIDSSGNDINKLPLITESMTINTSSSINISPAVNEEEKVDNLSCKDPADQLVSPQSSGLDAVENDLEGVSGVGSLVEGTISETVVLPPSTLVKERNGGSFMSSEPLEESMEKGVASSSGIQEEAVINKLETDVQMDSSVSQVLLLNCEVLPETVDLASCLMPKEEKIEGSSAKGLSISSSPLDELSDSKIELDDKNISQDGESLTGSGDNTSKSFALLSTPLVSKEDGIGCISDDVGSQDHSISERVPACSDDLSGKLNVPQVSQVIIAPETAQPSLSQATEEEKIENRELQMDKLPADSPSTVSHFVEGGLPLEKGNNSEVEICNQTNASHISEDNLETHTSKNMDVPSSCSLVDEDNVGVLSDKGEQTILEESCRDGTDVDRVDPGLTTTTMELSSSLTMDRDKVDDVSYDAGHLCNPLATVEPKDCLTQANCSEANEASNSSEAHNQMEASDDVAGNNAERLPLGNIDILSSSLTIKETVTEDSSDQGPLNSLPAPGQPENCLTREGGCSDAVEESVNSEAEVVNQIQSQVAGVSVDESRCLAVAVTAAAGKNEALPDEGPEGVFEAQNVSRGLAYTEDPADIIPSSAAETENVSRVLSSSTSVEKVDVTPGSSVVPETSQVEMLETTHDSSAVPETVSFGKVDVTPGSSAAAETVTVEMVDVTPGSPTVPQTAPVEKVDVTPGSLAAPETTLFEKVDVIPGSPSSSPALPEITSVEKVDVTPGSPAAPETELLEKVDVIPGSPSGSPAVPEIALVEKVDVAPSSSVVPETAPVEMLEITHDSSGVPETVSVGKDDVTPGSAAVAETATVEMVDATSGSSAVLQTASFEKVDVTPGSPAAPETELLEKVDVTPGSPAAPETTLLEKVDATPGSPPSSPAVPEISSVEKVDVTPGFPAAPETELLEKVDVTPGSPSGAPAVPEKALVEKVDVAPGSSVVPETTPVEMLEITNDSSGVLETVSVGKVDVTPGSSAAAETATVEMVDATSSSPAVPQTASFETVDVTPGSPAVPETELLEKVDVTPGSPAAPEAELLEKVDVTPGSPPAPERTLLEKVDVTPGSPPGSPAVPEIASVEKVDVTPGSPAAPETELLEKGDVTPGSPSGSPAVPEIALVEKVDVTPGSSVVPETAPVEMLEITHDSSGVPENVSVGKVDVTPGSSAAAETPTVEMVDVTSGSPAVPQTASVEKVDVTPGSRAAPETTLLKKLEVTPGSPPPALSEITVEKVDVSAGSSAAPEQALVEKAGVTPDSSAGPEPSLAYVTPDSLAAPETALVEVTEPVSPAVPETASVDGVSSSCPSAAGGEHGETLSEDLVGPAVVKLDTRESEVGVITNQENQARQENALKEMEKSPPIATEGRTAERCSEKDLAACSEIQQESKDSEIENSVVEAEDSKTNQ